LIRCTVLFGALLAFHAAPSCAADLHADACPSGRTVKGVEVYSWLTPDGSWKFAMLYGTNREKTEQEVRQSACLLTADELERAFARLAEGEYVFWLDKEAWDFAHPPQDMMDRFALAAANAGLRFDTGTR
jgi:hypothetical protein